ncbi:MAG: helix-hairpin-helix domain-containing protein [Vallitaleaceae bacterium]|nr:helix-hairpin-helix domain-containing protein [Vallitaleaceae bacterium]
MFVVISGVFYMFNQEDTKSYYYQKNAEEVEVSDIEGAEVPLTDVLQTNAVVSIEKSEVELYIHLCGAVKKAGVYKGKQGDRVCDLLEKAGGFSEEASTDYVNLAREVVDGEKIYIPTLLEVKEAKEAGSESPMLMDTQAEVELSPTKVTLVNINTASKAELMSLSGIGEAKALAIMEYRENNRFERIEDIKKVVGIKEAVFSSVKDKICVD